MTKRIYQILSECDAQDIERLLGGKEAAGLYTCKMDDILSKSIHELQSGRIYADLSYADCKINLETIEKHSRVLAKELEKISLPKLVADNNKKFQVAQLITNGMCNAHLDTVYIYPKFWELKEEIKLLHIGTEQALKDIKHNWDKYYPVDHPRNSFLKQSIAAYGVLFKKKPGIYRGSKFVEAIDKLLRIGGLEKEGVTAFKLLDRAKKQKLK